MATQAEKVLEKLRKYFYEMADMEAVSSASQNIHMTSNAAALTDLLNGVLTDTEAATPPEEPTETWHAPMAMTGEAWDEKDVVNPKEKGKYKGWTMEKLESRLASIKKSGPHSKGSKEYGTMKEIQFALRAKSGWGKVPK